MSRPRAYAHGRRRARPIVMLGALALLAGCEDESGAGPLADGGTPADAEPALAPDLAPSPDAALDSGPATDPAAYSAASIPTQPAGWYVDQALIYFDTLDSRADPAIVPEYAPDVARWEWPPWLYLTGWGAQHMITSTRAATRLDPSTVEDRDCRFFDRQPFARCYVNFVYEAGDCPIYEEFTFNDAGETTFIEAWSVLPGRMPVEDYAADPWAEGADADRLSTRIPGLGSPAGAIDLGAPWMLDAAAADADIADFIRRASDFWATWREAYDEAGGSAVYAIGCGWDAPKE